MMISDQSLDLGGIGEDIDFVDTGKNCIASFEVNQIQDHLAQFREEQI